MVDDTLVEGLALHSGVRAFRFVGRLAHIPRGRHRHELWRSSQFSGGRVPL